ncbi:hypothetical protein [Actinokineospora inagensis]|uniref:hypothetical protein n=1 Tax=Actinokineospora inagensis TaxID=103730 RepID=UPI000416A0F9|nr:hypothetical protein [Actinokineospora inagensis]
MPTPPRRRAGGPAARRPRVAGLRKPTAQPRQDLPEDPADSQPVEPPEQVRSARPRPRPAEPAADPDPAQEPADQAVTSGVIGGAGKPTGKRRETGAPVEPPRQVTTTTEQRTPGRIARWFAPSVWTGVQAGVVIVLFVAAGFWFKGEADALTSGVDGDNTALVDSAATSEVQGKLTVAVERTLSYSYTDLDASAKAVKETLAGTAVCQYDKLFAQLRTLAPEQKLVVTSKVRDMGIQRLEGAKADVLVFVDQSTTRADQDQTTASGALFGIRAEKLDGTWKITDFDLLDQPAAVAQAPGGCG